MKKWQYHEFISTISKMTEFLNELGDLGWELCESISLAPAKLGQRLFIMKREVSE